MVIALGDVTFDDAHTTVREKHEEVGGRDAREIELSGLIVGESSVGAIESKLDDILAAVSDADYGAVLSVRTGREMYVRRRAFVREVSGERLVGSFALTLDAENPFEVSSTETVIEWNITESGMTIPIAPGGNVFAELVVTLVAQGNVVNPTFVAEGRTLSYPGIVQNGHELVLDGVSKIATLGGEDVTPYTSGLFLRLGLPQSTVGYGDDESSSHTAAVTLSFRSRWW